MHDPFMSSSLGVAETSVPVSTLGTFTATNERTVLLPPGKDASGEERKNFLKYQLDCLMRCEVLGGWTFQDGLSSRPCGGMNAVHASVIELRISFLY